MQGCISVAGGQESGATSRATSGATVFTACPRNVTGLYTDQEQLYIMFASRRSPAAGNAAVISLILIQENDNV